MRTIESKLKRCYARQGDAGTAMTLNAQAFTVLSRAGVRPTAPRVVSQQLPGEAAQKGRHKSGYTRPQSEQSRASFEWTGSTVASPKASPKRGGSLLHGRQSNSGGSNRSSAFGTSFIGDRGGLASRGARDVAWAPTEATPPSSRGGSRGSTRGAPKGGAPPSNGIMRRHSPTKSRVSGGGGSGVGAGGGAAVVAADEVT